MKKLTMILLVMAMFYGADVRSDEITPSKKFTKHQIEVLSKVYINNNLNIKNPVMVDMDADGDFDILNYTDKGNIEYYKNNGTLEKPEFVLENKKFDNYEMNTLLPAGVPVPVFLANADNDSDIDIFGIAERSNKYEAMYIENTMDLDHYTLITIILVLVVVVLLIAIV
ncbi:MAG: VCBS repeat-containing protein [Ignavibacteria bacterium]|nr:VCBS repeat-containing protein [Ignavibacteria bacterium]